MPATSTNDGAKQRSAMTQIQSNVRSRIANIEAKFGRAFSGNSNFKSQLTSPSKSKEKQTAHFCNANKAATLQPQTSTSNNKLQTVTSETSYETKTENTPIQTLLPSDGELKHLTEAPFSESKKILVMIKILEVT